MAQKDRPQRGIRSGNGKGKQAKKGNTAPPPQVMTRVAFFRVNGAQTPSFTHQRDSRLEKFLEGFSVQGWEHGGVLVLEGPGHSFNLQETNPDILLGNEQYLSTPGIAVVFRRPGARAVVNIDDTPFTFQYKGGPKREIVLT